MTEFLMPALGADMEAGTLVTCRKQPGDALRRGDIIAEVETDKGVIEVEVFTTGTLERWLVSPGQKVPVGTPLAVLREDAVVEDVSKVLPEPSGAAPEIPAPSLRARISPAARRLAEQRHIDVNALTGTGADGAITLQDVERAQAAAAPTEAPAAASRQRALRRAIAAAMTLSKREIPHYYVATTIDLGRAMAWLAERNAQHPVQERVLYGALLTKATALAARRIPELNALWRGEQAEVQAAVHLGIAVSLRGGGLIAPALHDTDKLALSELMAQLQDLVTRARAGTLRSSELSDATLTMTSLGERGVETVYPIIYPPQTAIVGFGRMSERPWVVDGKLCVRPLVHATLAADHRATDGHTGARFLALIDQLLQEPESL